MSTFIALSKLDKLEDYVSSSSLLDMQRGENIKRKREPRSSVFLDVSSMLVYHRCLENWNNEFPLIILLFFSFFLSFSFKQEKFCSRGAGDVNYRLFLRITIRDNFRPESLIYLPFLAINNFNFRGVLTVKFITISTLPSRFARIPRSLYHVAQTFEQY